MGVSMIAMNLVTGLKSLINGIKEVKTAIVALNLAQKIIDLANTVVANKALEKSYDEVGTAARRAKKDVDALAAAERQDAKAALEDAAAQKVKNAAEGGGGTQVGKKTGKQIGKKATKKAATGAIGAEILSGGTELTGAVSTVGQAISTLIGSFLSAELIAVTGFAAAIVGIVAGIGVHIYKQTQENENKIKELEEESNKLQKELTDAQNSYKEFGDNLTGYSSAVDATKDLTKGTIEFKEAIEAANEEAKKLIETYGLFGQFSYDENGLIVFNEEALNRLQEKQDELQANIDRYNASYNMAQAETAEFSKNTAYED